MKTRIFIAAILAATTFTSCQKEIGESKKLFHAAIDESVKTTLGTDNSVIWEDNDEISINGKRYITLKGGSTKADFTAVTTDATPNAEGAAYTAFYPASISDMTFPTVQQYSTLRFNPMYAESSDQTLSFKNLCGIIEFRIKGNKTVKSILITSSNATLSGDFKIEDGAAVATSTSKKGVVLDCGDGVALTEAGTAFRVAVPPTNISKLKVVITATDGSTFEKTATSDILINRSHIQPVKIDSTSFTPIELPYEFTVDASGKKVKFSRGLLYWEGLQDKFQIEPNQYFSVPAELDGTSGNNWSGYEGGAHISFFPFTSIAANAKTKYYYAPTDVNQVLFAYNGGAIEGWTVLTADEWKYMLETRTVNGGTGKGKAYRGNKDSRIKVSGKDFSGVFIYPDNYTGAYNENTWEAVNEAGIVYLPANGLYGSTHTPLGDGYISNIKGRFFYCSPTLSKVESDTYYTKGMTWLNNAVSFSEAKAAIGFSIRLVKVQ